MQKQIRQGDVYLRPRKAPIPASATLVPRDGGRVILAYGEVTGHAHALVGDGVELWQAADGTRVLRVSRQDALTHEEHSAIDIIPGDYDVTIQREYTPEGLRNVAD